MRNWDLGTSFEVDPLFLTTMRSLRLLFSRFNAISSSSSSEVLSRRAITKIGAWTPKCLALDIRDVNYYSPLSLFFFKVKFVYFLLE